MSIDRDVLTRRHLRWSCKTRSCVDCCKRVFVYHLPKPVTHEFLNFGVWSFLWRRMIPSCGLMGGLFLYSSIPFPTLSYQARIFPQRAKKRLQSNRLNQKNNPSTPSPRTSNPHHDHGKRKRASTQSFWSVIQYFSSTTLFHANQELKNPSSLRNTFFNGRKSLFLSSFFSFFYDFIPSKSRMKKPPSLRNRNVFF